MGLLATEYLFCDLLQWLQRRPVFKYFLSDLVKDLDATSCWLLDAET